MKILDLEMKDHHHILTGNLKIESDEKWVLNIKSNKYKETQNFNFELAR